ncbi:CopL family metal-binding regulatory protein [Luteimonas sp. XNQY3]|nr:CopL family metal-binding regulatory protein [Luteimonas sp. XNQY3]MCD9006222.1 CopL family metal-binding regulatory protein [Luteimonas sp. XNQY3]
MSVRRFVLRLVLAMLLCLNGSGALWASTEMTIAATGTGSGPLPAHAEGAAHAHHAVSADMQASGDGHAHAGEDCQCGIGMRGGCGCSCAYPAGCITVGVPFSAHHVLPAAAPAYSEIRAPQQPSGKIFRPPIS